MAGSRRVLVLGAGGRESALAHALARSQSVAEVIVAPGNAGTCRDGAGGVAPIRSVPAEFAPQALVELARREAVDLCVVGPEGPLVAGVVDALDAAKIAVFGPSRAAAELEGSKAFMKRFAARHAIPTARYTVATSYAQAEEAIVTLGAPVVIKAGGLCAGKGVVVAGTVEEALAAARAMLVDGALGVAGATVVIEDFLRGEELSVHAISDGTDYVVLPPARDHKRVGDGDAGPNTGGMGAFAPVGGIGPEQIARIDREIVRPTIDGMRAEGRLFRGVLFAGLMITPTGEPMLLEHNVRFGDPECEVLMALLDGDVAELLLSAARGRLDRSAVRVATDRAALTVVLACEGYPTKPRIGGWIEGLDRAAALPFVTVHHAGTAVHDGRVVTAAGRVIAVTATGPTLEQARGRAYAAVDAIAFDGMHFRRDIAAQRTSDPPT